MKRGYGWDRSKVTIDSRDLQYSLAKPKFNLTANYDLRGLLPDCWDQGQTNSCISHGVGACVWVGEYLAGLTPSLYSRLFEYWNLRDLEGSTVVDQGGQIRDGIKAANRFGFVKEDVWPFDESKVLVQPPDDVFTQAIANRIHFYAGVDLTRESDIKLALSHKVPVTFGADIFQFFETDEIRATGVLQMPGFNETPIGGHCMAIVGNIETEDMWWVRNSWGTEWSIFKGYFKCPKKYIERYASDAWCIRIR